MPKVFSITQGLENMGAMKTGGQGSVYKAKRVGPIVTAIKILPTPIFSESADDKNYTAFQNEVEKLHRVNLQPNPHVVAILSSGFTDSGSFPFIEMEYIDGPDLEELLQSPHEKIFTIKEAIKVADQLSSALAHCHNLDVKHGDIKSNNVKFNQRTGNYVLLDFGLSAMSDEQRRTSLRHAGAIEFMAPEQNEGELLFESDVYSFGIILFELLAGTVPFVLSHNSEAARNAVRLAHIESSLPNMSNLRKTAVALTTWSEETKERETLLPEWLLHVVYKCLEKKPCDRFKTGVALHDYILLRSAHTSERINRESKGGELPEEYKKLTNENSKLQKQLRDYRSLVENKDSDLDELKAIISRKDNELTQLRRYNGKGKRRITPVKAVMIFLVIFLLGAFAAFAVFKNRRQLYAFIAHKKTAITRRQVPVVKAATYVQSFPNTVDKPTAVSERKQPAKKPGIFSTKKQLDNNKQGKDLSNDFPLVNDKPDVPGVNVAYRPQDKQKENIAGSYTVNNKAFFYNEADEATRRNAFMVHWNNAVLTAQKDEHDFIYVVYTNTEGKTSRGWLRKADLTRLK